MPFDDTTYREPLTGTEQEAKDDLFRWLDRFPDRVPALLEAVREGRMNGMLFNGPCRCIVGWLIYVDDDLTTADGSSQSANDVANGVGLDCNGPAEKFVHHAVVPGDTPSNSPVMARLERWILEWMA